MAPKRPKIEQIDQNRAEAGNTDSASAPPAEKQASQYTYWCFTYNNYVVDQIDQLEQVLKHECRWYVFQEEIGEDCGTPHLQGTLCLKVKQRMTQLKHINQAIHWSPTKSIKGSLAYCAKETTRAGKQYVYGIDIPEPVKVHEPRGWQTSVMNIIATEPDERTIHWYWENTGGVGKTALCKYLVVKHAALMLTGKSNDMYHMISKFPGKRKLFLIDVPRSAQDYINYGAIEQIKNGLIFSGKYEGAQLVFNSPHVFVFANQPPNYDMMSRDRWNVVCINDDDGIIIDT